MLHPLTTLLLDHRASGTPIAQLTSAHIPTNSVVAYQIQNETVEELGPICAWKVSPMPLNGEPKCSPILQANVYRDGASLNSSDFWELAVEAEIAVRINSKISKLSDSTNYMEAIEAVDSVHLALELVASRFNDRTSIPALAALADLQNAGGVVLGAPFDPSLMRSETFTHLTLETENQISKECSFNLSPEIILGAIPWLSVHARKRKLPLKEGDVVITGARLGPIPFETGKVNIYSNCLGAVAATFC
jgi:2-keto-4-pentenoate hydratase